MYTDTNIWQSGFEPNEDQYDHHRSRLRLAFLSFRERVGQLIQTIPAEIQGLTVHDLSHLDALWDMADILTGDTHGYNPAEIFVLGGAILLHDSAMTVGAYIGGIQEIKQTPEYADAFAQLQSHHPQSPFHTTNKSPADATTEQYAIGEALRIKHAHKAEELATQKWISPIDNSEVFLIDDTDLRDHFGRAIGRIAHSHHWDIHDIPKKLGTTLGALSGLPKEWTIDQIKIALLLRCIDAMQIDDRRAPRFLSAVRSIGTTSLEHWRFQNLLTVPHIEDQRLVYTSKRPFNVYEAPAWNLCFDTLQMIDRELRNANDLHLQKNLPQFLAKGVAGTNSPDALSKYVEVNGWKPLPLNLKVSNVPHLARTLGGKDLYNSPYAPLRELIQNAADAIEARALIEEDFSIDDGLISIRFIDTNSELTLQIEDNGIGMSERVLTTVLLDFGFSFWKSSIARSEFPGIQKDVDKFRGRYGIGFFSVFMWSSEVMVSSRRFNEGISESRVLDFQRGLESRPLLRPAASGENSNKWTTRIQLKLNKDFLNRDLAELTHYSVRPGNHIDNTIQANDQKSWTNRVRLLCGTLPIKVTLDHSGRTENCSLPNWRDCTAIEFFDFFNAAVIKSKNEDDPFINTLTSLSAPKPLGGRCFISPTATTRDGGGVAIYEKGIFVNFTRVHNIYGVVESSTTNAARDRFATPNIIEDHNWIKSVITKGFTHCKNIGEKIALQSVGAKLGHLDKNQPLFIRNRELISLSELYRIIENENFFSITLSEYSSGFTWRIPEKISIILGLSVDEKKVYPLIEFQGSIQKDSDITTLIERPNSSLFSLLKEITLLLGPSSEVQCEFVDRNGYTNSYCTLTILKKSGIPAH
ncbi:hypothetical protein CBP51_18690 [Cellvibrio mixtus]|uniref:HD-CE domain-containing protein n=1 Tax=Cellvibrio mixtus TaxID=39650 RepID=A0A266Q2I9_9GAMM|nr:ATP-binding protein [Cellvibrio mixtus]OZY83846.1 hypothetical protein CBP51_18690 [Cellvibrio mixtus]